MKKSVLWGILVVFSACNDAPKPGLLTFDVEKDYPEKELLLQDYWQVKYVPLETDSTFLVASSKPGYVGEEHVGFMDNRTGNMLFFDANTGRKSFCINRKGSGPEEYMGIGVLRMDERREEVYAWNHWNGVIMVYDTQGNLLRKLPLGRKGEMAMIASMLDVDENHFACSSYEPIVGNYSKCYFLNKNTGKTTLLDSIPQQRFVNPIIMQEIDGVMHAVEASLSPIVKCVGGFVYADHSNDTIYRVSPDGGMNPILARVPSVRETEPRVLLKYETEINDWIFLSAIELEYDFAREEGLRQKCYGIQKSNEKVYELKYVNADYPDGEYYVSDTNVFYMSADKLMEVLADGKLSGDLKAVAMNLKEDDNGILIRLLPK